MIKDMATADRIAKALIQTLDEVNDSIAVAKEKCPIEEFEAYRRAAGAVIYEICDRILNPIFTYHPALKPPGWE